MRGLTVRQPWAWATIHGGKDVENRSRSLGPYRGLVAIHAGRQPDSWWPVTQGSDSLMTALSGVEKREWWLLRGAVIGVANLVNVHRFDLGCCLSPWAMGSADEPDMHHLMWDYPRPLARPIPWRGAQGLWTVPADLEAAIREQVTL